MAADALRRQDKLRPIRLSPVRVRRRRGLLPDEVGRNPTLPYRRPGLDRPHVPDLDGVLALDRATDHRPEKQVQLRPFRPPADGPGRAYRKHRRRVTAAGILAARVSFDRRAGTG